MRIHKKTFLSKVLQYTTLSLIIKHIFREYYVQYMVSSFSSALLFVYCYSHKPIHEGKVVYLHHCDVTKRLMLIKIVVNAHMIVFFSAIFIRYSIPDMKVLFTRCTRRFETSLCSYVQFSYT